MDEHGLGDGPLGDVRSLTGGTQNILVQFTRADRGYVLRRPPPSPRPESHAVMRREAKILAALSHTQVPHPAFIASEADENRLGYAFFLMEPVNGFNPSEGLPEFHASDPAARLRMGLSYIEGLAALADVDYTAVGLSDFGKPERFLERQVGRWLAQLESYAKVADWTGLDCNIDKIADWLERNRPQDYRPGIIHGDCHIANTMFCRDSAEMAALIDWELATIGDPRLDLGWVMACWPDPDGRGAVGISIEPWEGFPDIQTLIQHYDARTSRSTDSAMWFGVLACFKLGILLEGTYARALAGKAPMAVGEKLHRATLALFDRAARWTA